MKIDHFIFPQNFYISNNYSTFAVEIKTDTIMSENNKVRIKKVLSWTFPYFGNRHTMPYGKLLVTDGETEKVVSTKGDTLDSYPRYYQQYITFKRKPYAVVTYYNEKKVQCLRLEPIVK